MTGAEIRHKYDGFARWYDLAEGLTELLGIRRLRRELLRRASGRILEVAAGTGKNLSWYPRARRITAGDFSSAMLQIARARAARLGLPVRFLLMDAEALPLRDETFDTVVSSLSLCTFPDPVAALREMARVCRPDGRILLLEPGRSDREWLGRWQDRKADRHAKRLGCRWNREPQDLVRRAGLRLRRAERTFFGVFHVLDAGPAGPSTTRVGWSDAVAAVSSGRP
jgi:ubiquinone/menaquinone biosynthesis C-methylase UbiE